MVSDFTDSLGLSFRLKFVHFQPFSHVFLINFPSLLKLKAHCIRLLPIQSLEVPALIDFMDAFHLLLVHLGSKEPLKKVSLSLPYLID